MTIRIICGDARDILKTLPSNSVQACVSSPPYFNLRSYLPEGHSDKQKEIGAEKSPDEYIAALVAVFREVRRVLRTDGTCWLNLGDSYNAYNVNRGASRGLSAAVNEAMPSLPSGAGLTCKTLANKQLLMIPARVAIALQADGWWLRSQMPWVKRSAMPESTTDRPTSAVEYVFLLTKKQTYFYDSEAIKRHSAESSENRLRQNVAAQKGSDRAAGGAKTNGPMRAVGGSSRSFRNTDLFFDSLTEPYGAITDGADDVLALDVNPGGYSDAHFATFPDKLIEPLIRAGTSERGACPSCGTPWARLTEVSRSPTRRGGYSIKDGRIGGDSMQEKGRAENVTSTTTGWAQSCPCPPAEPRPCVVLDPFSGAGTTALVADRLRRDAIGIELNPAYAALSTQRITADAGLFAEVSA